MNKVAILGYGKEGKSAEKYFSNQEYDIKIFDQLNPAEFSELKLDDFNLILRSPSIPPKSILHPEIAYTPKWSSVTEYFFQHCPAPIIGITGTKGKGTTCSILRNILQDLGQKVWLVGNIGTPALDVLDKIKTNDTVIYELSSFQLWDLSTSPHIAVILKIEPDHLNVHLDFNDYLTAKSNIIKWQTANDICIYYDQNPNTAKIAAQSPATKIHFPVQRHREKLNTLLDSLRVVGQHNRENAEAALLAAASVFHSNLPNFIDDHFEQLAQSLKNFQGLPHRIQFLRTLDQIDYYDDNFSTTLSSTSVALDAFPDSKIILITGGRDKTQGADLPKLADLILQKTAKAILIGESGRKLAKILPPESYQKATSLTEAVQIAHQCAKDIQQSSNQTTVVLMSPAAASFDMFESVYDRGTQFQKIIRELKNG